MTSANDNADNSIIADIAIIGSGIACTATLISLFEQLLINKPKKTLQVIVIEKHHELWKGIPYGSRSSVNGLTITTINDFFTDEKENKNFFHWFKNNLDRFIAEFKNRGGDAAKVWLANNAAALANNSWNDIYLPRFIIGDYLQQKFLALKKNVEENGYAKLEVIFGETTELHQIKDGYNLKIINEDNPVLNITAKKVVIAIGSAPERKLTHAFDNSTNVMYVNRIYMPSMEENILLMTSKLADLPPADRNILIVGSNASTIELLYLIGNTPAALNQINNITLLSTSGKLPAHITYSVYSHIVNANLNNLEQKGNYTIENLVDAASKDITSMRDHEVSVPDIDKIISHTLRLLQPLDDDAKKLFYGIYGVQLAKLFRRSGTEYKRASDALIKSNKLQLIKGSFISIEPKEDKAMLRYSDTNTQKQIEFQQPFKVVINNTGSEDLAHSSSPLIQNLIHQNHLKVNPSGKAFEVNEKLEAVQSIYVIGPLAGGNYNKLLKFWHLENASRIMYLAPYLAKELLAEVIAKAY